MNKTKRKRKSSIMPLLVFYYVIFQTTVLAQGIQSSGLSPQQNWYLISERINMITYFWHVFFQASHSEWVKCEIIFFFRTPTSFLISQKSLSALEDFIETPLRIRCSRLVVKWLLICSGCKCMPLCIYLLLLSITYLLLVQTKSAKASWCYPLSPMRIFGLASMLTKGYTKS